MTGGSIDALGTAARARPGQDIEQSRRSASDSVVISPDGYGPAWLNLTHRPTATCTIVPVLRKVLDLAAASTPGLADRLKVTPDSVHIVPVIICVDDGGSLPITRADERAGDRHHGCHDLSQIAAQRGAFKGMRADSTSRPTDGQTIVGVRSGTLLDPELVAELRAVAARNDIAQRVLTILEPGQAPKSLASDGQHRR